MAATKRSSPLRGGASTRARSVSFAKPIPAVLELAIPIELLDYQQKILAQMNTCVGLLNNNKLQKRKSTSHAADTDTEIGRAHV